MSEQAGWHRGYHTESANTVITEIVEPIEDMIIRVTQMIYRAGTTAHSVRLMRPIAETTTTAAAAAAQQVMALTSVNAGLDSSGAAETLAGSDYLAWKDTNGVYQFDLVSSVSSLNVTMTSNLPTAVDSGAPVWMFYEVGRSSHETFNPGVSATRTYRDGKAGIFQAGLTKQVDRHNERNGKGDPILFHSNNATAAGFLEALSGIYV
jgi:hypothetical protein